MIMIKNADNWFKNQFFQEKSIGIFNICGKCWFKLRQLFNFDKTDINKYFCSLYEFMVIPNDLDF